MIFKLCGVNKDSAEKLVTENSTGNTEKMKGATVSQSKGLSNRGLSSGGKKLSKKEKRELRQNQEMKKAEIRKLELSRRKTRNVIVASVTIIALVGLSLGYNMLVLNADDDDSSNSFGEIKIDDVGEIIIPKSEIVDDANFYKYDANGTEIRVFAVRGSDGKEHVAFDACDQCYNEKKGYRQEGENMTCNNCGDKFAINSLGTENTEGGCWPSYLEITDDGDNIVLKGEELEKNKFMFE